MGLYKINVQHVAPKDSHTSIETFVYADSEEKVYAWLDKEKAYGRWSDREEKGETLDIYDEDYNVIGGETFKEKMMRLKGELYDEDRCFDDAHYGLTFYGWEKVDVQMESPHVASLKGLGILIEL